MNDNWINEWISQGEYGEYWAWTPGDMHISEAVGPFTYYHEAVDYIMNYAIDK